MDNLTKSSLILSIIGIFLLLLIINNHSQELTPISKISIDNLNQPIQINARIISSKAYGDFQILSLEDSSGKIQGILNSKTQINVSNKNLTITGKITDYQKAPQIQIDKISK